VFNENTFRALDWLLDEARLHGLRVVLSFIDNWKYPGTRRRPSQRMQWPPPCVMPVPASFRRIRAGCLLRCLLLRAGGVDEYVDWSLTAPRRTQARPRDEEGDSVFVVRRRQHRSLAAQRMCRAAKACRRVPTPPLATAPVGEPSRRAR
jgi:hypothetical protein